MRILYMIDEMQALTDGGTERQVLQMIALMKQAGADVHLCTLRGTEWLTAEQAGCPVEHFHYRSFWRPGSIMELLRLRRWMRDKKVEILQTFFVEANILGPLVGRMASVPIILGSRRNLNYWMSPLAALAQRIANRFAMRLVANCNAVKQHVIATESVDAGKVDVMYNGLDAAHFAPNDERRRQLRQEYGFRDSDVVVGAVSVLRPIKGCETFIDAAGEVLRQDPNARFVLVGDGPLRSSLETRAASLGDRFRFAGAQKDIRPFLNMFDIGVLASESEGFSNSILEYLAAGLPCVVTNVGGNPEAIENAGVVVTQKQPAELAEAVLILLRDRVRRASLSTKALARAKDFDLESTQSKLAAYYERLLGLH
ncbi:MAG: glycosyltransferase [Terriglobales bacterium]